ncbi:MAG: TRAP transporter fused permease subunit, partial [Alphaproteobacteria bacterium]|nr:TRAP transporter fused permease subunit [Alphaproteobacteria bacterium]
VYTVVSGAVSIYMYVEFEELGTVRAGIWDPSDLWMGGAMVVLIMEYARKRHFALFIINIILILYAVYGWIVPGMFNHPGLGWSRIVSMTSVEDTTGIFSDLPQLALTLIGSFVLVLSTLRAFGCIDSILGGASQIAVRSPYALPQTAVIGSFGVASVSGSGAANAVTTGSATIPALIKAGMPRASAASVETASSLGGQLMPPIMGISAFLMAEFLDRSYFDVVARGYAPALIYFAGVSLGVYLMSVRFGGVKGKMVAEQMTWTDWTNIGGFVLVVAGLIVCMAIFHQPPMFAALYIFAATASFLFARHLLDTWLTYRTLPFKAVFGPVLRFADNFASMTSDLTLLLATLSILTAAFVNTGVPTKVGFILVDAAAINLAVLVLVAFVFGALLGMGLPPAPTYILTALVIAPHMIKAGVSEWPVHFFAFFLAVWGELTPPTSVVAAVTSRIANASFFKTLWRAIELCITLFVLMVAVFTRPELVNEPNLAQLAAMFIVLTSAFGLIFSIQARFSAQRAVDIGLRIVLAGFALVVLMHPDRTIALFACIPVGLFIAYWLVFRRNLRVAPQT